MAKDRNDVSGMNKQQLLEILIEQSKEADSLKRENIALQKELMNAKKLAEGYRSDLDHAFSLLRLTMRLEKIIKKLDPSYVPENYEPEVMARINGEPEEKAAADAAADEAKELAEEIRATAEEAAEEIQPAPEEDAE